MALFSIGSVFLGIDKKQANIGVNEAKEITNKLALKSFEGGYKIMIIWMAEKMKRRSL